MPTIAVNDAWEWAPHTQWLYACDLRWWDARWHALQGKTLFTELWTRDGKAAQKYGIHYVESKPLPGLSRSRALIHEGANSGYQAIDLALSVLGFRRVILLGFDCKGSTGKTHFFGRHEDRGIPDRPDYGDLPQYFAQMRPERYGLEVINCTADTALTCFPRCSIDDALSLPAPK